METNSEMLRGHIDTIILLSLVDDDKHTNQIREEIEQRAAGKFELKNGTFYSCLQRIVKQGYVTEYRTTSSDGVRRKFYQLTEKGKNYIDENKDKWVSKRELINDLISAPESKKESVPEVKDHSVKMHSTSSEPYDVDKALREFMQQDAPAAKPVPKAENKPAEKDDLSHIISNSNNVKILSFDQIAFPEVENIKKEEPKPKHEHREPTPAPKKPNSVANFDLATDPDSFDVITLLGYDNYKKATENATKSQALKEDVKPEQRPVEQPAAEIKVEQEPENKQIPPEIIKETVVEQPLKVAEEPKQAPAEVSVVEPVPVEKVRVEQKKAELEEDDFYQTNSPIHHDYKNVLEKLFPKQKPAVEPKKETIEIDYHEGMDINEFLNGDKSTKPSFDTEKPIEPQIQAEVNHKKQPKKVVKETHHQQKVQPQPKEQTEGFDFSDIQAFAKAEGFKISVSNGVTKRKVNSIYSNKLVAISSLIFYAFVLIELFLLAHFTATTAQVNKSLFIICGAIVAILPITSLLLYALEPKKRVAQLPTMKSIVEFISVIMLNLFLIVIVFAILSNVDFSSSMQLMRYILYPTIVILNIPVYFIIKYLCLDNKRFYA